VAFEGFEDFVKYGKPLDQSDVDALKVYSRHILPGQPFDQTKAAAALMANLKAKKLPKGTCAVWRAGCRHTLHQEDSVQLNDVRLISRNATGSSQRHIK
jgi:hypothetical protein